MKGAATVLGILFLLTHLAAAQWLPRETTSARAFVYDYTQEKENPTLWKPGNYHKGIINKGGAELSHKQFERLKLAMRSTLKRERGAMCYEPHHGFVFYDAEGVPMGHIELCFQCGNVSYSPRGLPNVQWNWIEMEKILDELDLPILNKNKAYTQLFTGQVDDGLNGRKSQTAEISLPEGKKETIDIPEQVYLSTDGILTLYPGDKVYLEFEEEDGKFSKPKVVYKPRNRDRTIIIKMLQDEKGTTLARSSQMMKTISVDCEHRKLGSEDHQPTILRPTEKGLTVYDTWPADVCSLRLENIQVSDRPAAEIYQEKKVAAASPAPEAKPAP